MKHELNPVLVKRLDTVSEFPEYADVKEVAIKRESGRVGLYFYDYYGRGSWNLYCDSFVEATELLALWGLDK